MLEWFSENKLLALTPTDSDASLRPPYPEALEVLIEEGYITKATLRSNLYAGDYYMLTAKGCACFTRPEVDQLIGSELKDRTRRLPAELHLKDSLLTSPGTLTAVQAVQLAFIRAFCERTGQNIPIFRDADDGVILGIRPRGERLLCILTALFDADSDLKRDLDVLSPHTAPSDDNDRNPLLLIVFTQKDALILAEALKLNETSVPPAFSVIDEDYAVYCLEDGALILDDTFASALPDEDSVQSKEDSAFVAALKQRGAFLSDEDAVDKPSIEENANAEAKKVSSSIFASDLSKGYENAHKRIVEALRDSSCSSPAHIAAMTHMSEDVASVAFDLLFRKGYLRRYTLPGGAFYVPSPRLERALQFADACRYIGVRKPKDGFLNRGIDDTPESAAVRLAQIVTEMDAYTRIVQGGAHLSSAAASIGAHGFAIRLSGDKGTPHTEVLLCALWRNADECDEFLSQAEEHIFSAESIDRLTVASLTFDKAAALADAILETSGLGDKCPAVTLYSILDGTYADHRTPPEPDPEDKLVDAPENEPVDALENEPDSASENELNDASENEPDNASENELDDALEDEPAIKTLPVQSLPELSSASSEADILNNVCEILLKRRFYAATAYLKANLGAWPALQGNYTLLAYALNDPMAHCVYQADTVYSMVSTRSAFEDALIIAIAVRTFYSNQNRYDHGITALHNSVKEYPLMKRYPSLNDAVYKLMRFKNDHQKGMEAYAAYRLKNKAQLEEEIAVLRREAQNFYNSYIAANVRETVQQRRFIETKKAVFDISGDLGFCLNAIVKDERDSLPLVHDFLCKNFYRDGVPITPEGIDADMLWDYIVLFWENAREKLLFQKHETLKGRLRNNITSLTAKALQIIAKWCALLEQVSDFVSDDGSEVYKAVRKPTEDMLLSAISEINADTDVPAEERAALCVLTETLREVHACISGTFNDRARLYFYAPFLLTDDVMLHEDYTPDFDMHSTTLKAFTPAARILAHVRNVTNAPHTYRDRLKEIIDEDGDDFGAAQLIMQYLSEMEHDPEAYSRADTLNDSISYARNAAQLRRDDFVGELELAQSYGQIDNSEVNRTEIILQAVDNWYDWAVESCNFGFFKKVMDAYLADIRASCKLRETDLLARLEHFKQTSALSASPEARKARIQKINQAISEQKYTVAEYLLGRPIDASDDAENIVPEDFLKDFLDNYGDYSIGLNSGSSFENLVSKRVRNKEERGALKLAQNWLPGGSTMGRERLLALLDGLGIKGVAATPDYIDKFEGYIVSATREAKSQRHSYTHPIAAFGSGIWRDGFRVVCLNGKYDADMLIDVMKQIGNAYHTLILLDCALSLSERRHLACKAKLTLDDKMIGVIDRTVMMFLMRNYDGNKILRMLMSLIAPFACYQPYVWESANVMPPELFMGRKSELEKIKSVNGVNIVYGGRQLGKSALLKQARDAVEGNIVKEGSGAEYAERAVYIEIKGLDYQSTARRISQELYDQGILPDDINTTDWDELSRAVKRRLRQDGPGRIPYLLLLLDEADAFIESCETVNYMPFDKLKEMQNVGTAHFKFVVAGLRNVVRFKREAALGHNSVLTHLQAMTVKPFSVSEARELLEVPLYYLGLRFPREKESLITLILATTNYFPGLIQMYCAKLLEAMRSKDYAGYSEADSPAYVVSVDHIKKVLADPEFTQQIWDKYFITLKLDEDDYYYVIALLMAYLYRENRSSTGYSLEDIKKTGAELDIRKIAALSNEKLNAFMEELIELNVLRKSDSEHYLFTRYTFFQMMMDKIDIEDELYKYMEA